MVFFEWPITRIPKLELEKKLHTEIQELNQQPCDIPAISLSTSATVCLLVDYIWI